MLDFIQWSGNLCFMRNAFAKLFCLIVLFAISRVEPIQAQESVSRVESAKITIGVVEDVILSPWGVRFPARIDTGADLSSLDAQGVVVRNNVAAFKLGKRYGDLQLQLPVVEWRNIQTAMGTESRPVVEISICLGSKLFRTPVTLKDRSEMIYPFLIGRSALSRNFVIDPSRSRAAHPTCSPA
jgi:hypothetical protein